MRDGPEPRLLQAISFVFGQMDLGRVIDSSKIWSILRDPLTDAIESRLPGAEHEIKFGFQQMTAFLLRQFKENGRMLMQMVPWVLHSHRQRPETLQTFFELVIENFDLEDEVYSSKLNCVFLAKQGVRGGISPKFVDAIIAHNLTCRR